MITKQILALLLCASMLLATVPTAVGDDADQFPAPATPTAAKQTPEQLQQLVAPIALYPDALVAQILAAATYPTQVVEADRWMQEHSNLKGQQLADEINKQPWDTSVKALAQFPSVLANMDKNLSWTSSLGDAYVNQQQDVMDAVQAMRARAQGAGNLKNTAQEIVTNNGSTIAIQPAEPDVVYLPAYDPWIVYGAPVMAWPGWYAYPGLYVTTPGIAFGIGFGLGFFGGFAWGWPHWGFDWAHRSVIYNHNTYISHSRIIVNRINFVNHNAFVNHNNSVNHNDFSGGHLATTQHGAFGGYDHGGVVRGYSDRGRSSFSGGFHEAGGFRAGGGFHGGGAHGGGGRR